MMKRSIIGVVAAILLSLSGVAMTSSPAAAGTPVAYRQAGNHWSPMYGMPNANTYVQQWLQPGEPFWMNCWTDNNNYPYTGNYYSVRWFYGQSKYHGWGYVHSSYIYYQWSVPHC